MVHCTVPFWPGCGKPGGTNFDGFGTETKFWFSFCLKKIGFFSFFTLGLSLLLSLFCLGFLGFPLKISLFLFFIASKKVEILGIWFGFLSLFGLCVWFFSFFGFWVEFWLGCWLQGDAWIMDPSLVMNWFSKKVF